MSANYRYISLSHTLTDNMAVYPGATPPSIKKLARVEEKGYELTLLTSGPHVGTHIDAPLHMVEGGLRIDEIPLEHFFGQALVVDVVDLQQITPDVLAQVDLEHCDIVLFHTGFDSIFGQKEYFEAHPVLTPQAAHMLVEKGIKIAGFDCPSPDRAPFDIHKILLGNQVLLIENLRGLAQLIGQAPFEFIALPPRIEAEAAFINAVAKIPNS